jgi:undecaprenyl diphosphate synthase
MSLIAEVYTPEERTLIEGALLPKHVAIIMDGNRRWARKHELPYMAGHWKGAEVITQIVKAAAELGIKVLTVYAFSTENWGRTAEEIEALMHLYKVYLIRQREFMVEAGIKLDAIGDLSRLPADVLEALNESKLATRHCSKMELVLALNYGGRDDIRRAVVAVLEDHEEGKLTKQALTEQVFSSYLDTAKWQDPSLLIRTSGEQRVSNFLLWQISYSEVYISKVLWPDFNEKELLKAVVEYQQRERRLGG